jgi:hypothetical protein
LCRLLQLGIAIMGIPIKMDILDMVFEAFHGYHELVDEQSLVPDHEETRNNDEKKSQMDSSKSHNLAAMGLCYLKM